VGPRDGLDPTGTRTPFCSQSQYRLSYPGSITEVKYMLKVAELVTLLTCIRKCTRGPICSARGWKIEGSEFESRWGQEFSILQIVQNGSEVHPTSYPMSTGGGSVSPGVKRPGREVDHSPQTSAEVKKMWIYTSTPHTPSWRSA
jgi:hypothetical protein